ncbi:hypothetical protein BE20_04680 [Sorangium cellulosum]|nr:hypothetical protein BE20_04680 [Sorangium cellulosum]
MERAEHLAMLEVLPRRHGRKIATESLPILDARGSLDQGQEDLLDQIFEARIGAAVEHTSYEARVPVPDDGECLALSGGDAGDQTRVRPLLGGEAGHGRPERRG